MKIGLTIFINSQNIFTMTDIDLYQKMICYDCNDFFLISGSAPAHLTACTKCKGKNYEYARFHPDFKPAKKEKK